MNLLRTPLRVLTILSLCHTSSLAGGQAQQTYFVGNSLTEAIGQQTTMQSFANVRDNAFVFGKHERWGSSLQYVWENPTDVSYVEPPFGAYQNAFANYEWDVVSLQPFGRPMEGPGGDRAHVANFINLARGNSPNARFYLYEQWPEKPGVAQFDFDAMWNTQYSGQDDATVRTRDYYETLTQTIRQDFSALAQPVMLVPAGDVMYELNQRMHAAQVPGFTDIEQFYGDNIHLNAIGSYMLSVTFYATMFKENPVGLPYDNTVINDPAVALQIQDAAWKVVSAHALSGVPEPAAATSLCTIALVTMLTRRHRWQRD